MNKTKERAHSPLKTINDEPGEILFFRFVTAIIIFTRPHEDRTDDRLQNVIDDWP